MAKTFFGKFMNRLDFKNKFLSRIASVVGFSLFGLLGNFANADDPSIKEIAEKWGLITKKWEGLEWVMSSQLHSENDERVPARQNYETSFLWQGQSWRSAMRIVSTNGKVLRNVDTIYHDGRYSQLIDNGLRVSRKPQNQDMETSRINLALEPFAFLLNLADLRQGYVIRPMDATSLSELITRRCRFLPDIDTTMKIARRLDGKIVIDAQISDESYYGIAAVRLRVELFSENEPLPIFWAYYDKEGKIVVSYECNDTRRLDNGGLYPAKMVTFQRMQNGNAGEVTGRWVTKLKSISLIGNVSKAWTLDSSHVRFVTDIDSGVSTLLRNE